MFLLNVEIKVPVLILALTCELILASGCGRDPISLKKSKGGTTAISFADATAVANSVKVTVHTEKFLGSINKYPLGNYNDSGVWEQVSTPYPYNPWAYLWTAEGNAALKKLGLTNWVLTSHRDDWKDPSTFLINGKPSTWFKRSDPSKPCNPRTEVDCAATENVTGWCGRVAEVPLSDWLSLASSSGGPITFVANIGTIYHLKPDYFTVCENGQPRLKSRSNPNFVGPLIDVSKFSFSEVKTMLAPYRDQFQATPQHTIDFLKTAKSLGHSVAYVEVSMEPWNEFRPSNLDPADYIVKVKNWYKEIKAYDSSVQVGVAALQIKDDILAKGLIDNDKWNPWNKKLFLQAKGYFDFIVMHHYYGFNFPYPTMTDTQAAKFSYFVPLKTDPDYNQIVQYSAGDTSFIYRNQLLFHAPDKVNTPIHMAWNVWGPHLNDGAPNNGSRLLTGLSNASFYLNELWPQKVGDKLYPGVKHAHIGGIEGSSAWYQYPRTLIPPGAPVFYPIWYIFEALSGIKGQKILGVESVNSPNSALPERDALEIWAVANRKVTRLQIIMINHDPTNDLTTKIELPGFSPSSRAVVTTVGEGRDLSLLSFNDYANPSRVSSQEKALTLDLYKNGIKNFVVPAHSFVVLTVNGTKI